MISQTHGKGLKAAASFMIFSIGLTMASVVPSLADAAHPNIVQRHPTATGFVAGVGVHHALKVSAANKKRRHQKLSFAEKHPTMTGLAAGLATRAAIKHTTH
ncbi:hypothetical protein CCAX7_63970 [Capsulimonas corticalis]|uniref:Uncharacterized protein n=1 Tax=Capsulimonas corticalis TaxID=2219043 RepID=A0A402CX27_9BACT|nr:hypothetical protein [Capsulimonas corticalis]BDI34346.1 hypothetical protein CCAX7_63970 [Capsulimonas corticalis]